MDEDFVTVANSWDFVDAHLLAGTLRAAGLDATVGDAHQVQTDSLLTIAFGGIKVRVPAPQAAEARTVLAALREGLLALPDDSEAPRETPD